MSKRENRRDPRVDIALDVKIQTAVGETTFQTKDISYRGVFILCSDPFPLRKLVRFKTVVDDQELQMMGLVAHRLNAPDAAERGVKPGMGIQLYSVGDDTRDRWRQYVRDCYEADPDAAEEMRASELPRIRIHLATEAMMKQFMERDFPSGSIFYRTPDVHPVGTRVLCEVSHPTTGEHFQLQAQVSEVSDGPRRNRGMRVDFLELSEASDERFDDFFGRRDDDPFDMTSSALEEISSVVLE